MHTLVFYVASAWLALLLTITALVVVRSSSLAARLLAMDTLGLLVIALLLVYASASRSPHHLDAALLLTLLSFVATLAAGRYMGEKDLFS